MTRREALAVALVAAYSIVLNTVVPLWAHVPAGLAAATGLALLARADGASTADLGLRRSDAAGGLRLGALVAVPVAVALAAALALPATRRLLASNPAVDAGTARFLYEVCVRIPFGTALVEELVFRGALLAMILRRHGTKTAVAATSALFGLWHVRPRSPPCTRTPAGTSPAVAQVAPSSPSPSPSPSPAWPGRASPGSASAPAVFWHPSSSTPP